MQGWLFPYIRSRVLPGEFPPIVAYLFWGFIVYRDQSGGQIR